MFFVCFSPGFLPDPKDGSLYVFGDVLKKLPFTIPELVTASPCKSTDGVLYTGNTTFPNHQYSQTGNMISGQQKDYESMHLLIGLQHFSSFVL